MGDELSQLIERPPPSVDEERFWLVDLPDGDRRYIWRRMTVQQYERFKAEGGRVLKVVVEIPQRGKTEDATIRTSAQEWVGEFGGGMP